MGYTGKPLFNEKKQTVSDSIDSGTQNRKAGAWVEKLFSIGALGG